LKLLSIDLNADVGEGMADEELLPFVTSVNVACGFHAGDPATMDETVAAALERGVHVGAHPGFPDRENFGRLPMAMPPDAIERMVLYQVAALDGFARSRGGSLSHVKPHGALYHMAGESLDVARAIARGVRRYDPALVLLGAAGSKLLEAGREAGLSVAAEAFADRRYRPDGTLVPRGRSDALLTNPDDAVAQAVSIARDGVAIAADGSRLEVRADSICLHGDTPGAAAIARRVAEGLRAAGIGVAPLETRAAGGRPGAPISVGAVGAV
jgi:5-oxoprolinase (ATP-hydrolysing) subunit A